MSNIQETTPTLSFAFFGTSHISVIVLEELLHGGLTPTLIVTAPPKQKGRGLSLAPSEVKVWADAHHIPTLEPEKLNDECYNQLLTGNFELFVIASYGKIIPERILNMPRHGTLNVHPSLLPKLRGASPLQGSILEDIPVGSTHETGVTIMLIDEEVDHGPIVAQEKISLPNWPPKGSELEHTLGVLGGKLLVKTIPLWTTGAITPCVQEHSNATYTKKVTKGSGHIDLADDPERMYRKIRAFDVWPRSYFTTTRSGREIRVIVTDAKIEDGKLVPLRVIPEGKKEMNYEDFLRGQK